LVPLAFHLLYFSLSISNPPLVSFFFFPRPFFDFLWRKVLGVNFAEFKLFTLLVAFFLAPWLDFIDFRRVLRAHWRRPFFSFFLFCFVCVPIFNFQALESPAGFLVMFNPLVPPLVFPLFFSP